MAVLAIAGFELRTKLKRISTVVYFVVYAVAAAMWIASAGGAFTSAVVTFGTEKVYVNSPIVLAQTVTVLGLLGIVTVAAFMGRAIQQDFEYESHHFFFTSPISKADYLIGRFLGAVAILFVIFVGIALGVVLGAYWPGIDASRIGPWRPLAIAWPFLVMLLPNVLFLGACFFMLAALGRRMLPVYIAGVVVLIGYLVALRLLRDIDNRTLAALIDPVGSTALSLVSRYWSPAERNENLVPLAGEILWNRALWMTVGVAAFAAGLARFRMSAASARAGEKKVKDSDELVVVAAATAAIPAAPMDTSTGAYLRALPGLTGLYLRETVKNVYFVVLALSGALFIFANAKVVGSIYGTNTYPVTYQVLDFVSGTFSIFMVIITAFYAGELVWRERDARVALIVDATPAPTWLSFAGKLLTLMGVQVVLQAVVMLCGIIVQLVNGYTRFEIGQYLYTLFVMELPTYWMVAALALTIHSLVNHKYLGHFLVVLYWVAMTVSEAFGYDLKLYRFARSIDVTYSDMNGYGAFLGPFRWYQLYWGAASILLLVAAKLYWVRGTDTGWKVRTRVAKSRWTPAVTATTALAGVTFLGAGGWIAYNTMILNKHRNEFARGELQANYEKQYKSYAAKPQPKVTGVKIAVDLFPQEHRAAFKGSYALKNQSGVPVAELYLGLLEEMQVRKLGGSIPMKLVEEKRDLGWLRYALERPLAPGEAMSLDFDLLYDPPGFTNSGPHRYVVDNGTFINNSLVPWIGYQDRAELSQDQERKKHGLAPKERMPDLDNAEARKRNYISSDSDWIDFDSTVCTAPDQTALAPGYLQREWTEGGRRCFHYKMDVPILHFYSFLSARYAVKKGVWTGDGKEVPIEVYYQPGHEYNVDAMITGVKDSLDYFTKNFSPYQHRQVRILEFPRYATFAQAFPNTIPYSEAIGFIAKVDPKDPKDLDYPYYITAHEIAHQWWAHQVIGANVQGATMMSETLAQYSALMVMKKKYGDAKMKRFLKYELDTYLRGRAGERQKEQPLFRNENQPYIHYRKGSVAMYAFQDAVGEEAVNRALAAYIKKVAYQQPPYTTSRELLAEFRAVTPAEYQYLLVDLFETITLWENRAISATSVDKGGGKHEVALKISAKKMRVDDTGKQSDVPMDDLVDIGVLDDKDGFLYLKKHRLKSGEATLVIEVNGKAAKAGIDPVVKLIDRRPDDNVIAVKGPG